MSLLGVVCTCLLVVYFITGFIIFQVTIAACLGGKRGYTNILRKEFGDRCVIAYYFVQVFTIIFWPTMLRRKK